MSLLSAHDKHRFNCSLEVLLEPKHPMYCHRMKRFKSLQYKSSMVFTVYLHILNI